MSDNVNSNSERTFKKNTSQSHAANVTRYNLYFVQEVYCTERISLNPDFSEQIRASAMLASVSFTVPVQKLNRLLVTRQPFALT